MKELQTFLGMIVYFAVLIPRYAGRMQLLFQLLKKMESWKWKKEEEEKVLREHLSQCPF